MKILVTGGCGFIGQSLCKRLILEGYEVDVIDNLYIGKEAKIIEGCNFLGGDVRAMENISDKSYDWIYHLAAFSRVGLSYENQHYTFSANVDGTKSVLEYAKRNGSKVIFASSSSVHHSVSPYSSSKRMGEELCKFYKNGMGIDITIVRLYNVYGDGELINSHMAALIGLWRGQFEKNYPITIIGDGNQRRDFTHIDDTIDGLLKIMETDKRHEDAWELGTGKNYSINEVADMFINKFNCVKVYMREQKGNYKGTLRINNDAIERLGWFPKDRLKEYIDSL